MAMGEADKVIATVEHELFTTRLALALYDSLPDTQRYDLNRQYPDFRRKLWVGGEHHDFEKRSWPTDLLCGDRHPTRNEWYEWIIPHPERSAAGFKRQLGADSVIEAMILYHHVRWDGKSVEEITSDGRRVPDYAGYPEGPSGEDIPFGARILKVCDAVAAMVTKRNYRNREISAQEAIKQVYDRAGSEYDPLLAMLFAGRFSPGLIVKLADGEKN